MTSGTFTIRPRGSFSLRQSVEFGFGQRHSERFDGAMRMAFVADDLAATAAVVLRETQDQLTCAYDLRGGASQADIERQVTRILSLDHDGDAYDAIVAADPILAKLHSLRPGMRPPLFHSPYEAAAWGVLSARFRKAPAVRDRLAREHGERFELEGVEQFAFPAPEALLAMQELEGLPAQKLDRLHGVARAALDGQLEIDRLTQLGPGAATTDLQQIPGIGPFYAGLVVIRGCGFTDVLPTTETRLLALVGELWGLGAPATPAQLSDIAEAWAPFRTWCSVLVRAAGPALVDQRA